MKSIQHGESTFDRPSLPYLTLSYRLKAALGQRRLDRPIIFDRGRNSQLKGLTNTLPYLS